MLLQSADVLRKWQLIRSVPRDRFVEVQHDAGDRGPRGQLHGVGAVGSLRAAHAEDLLHGSRVGRQLFVVFSVQPGEDPGFLRRGSACQRRAGPPIIPGPGVPPRTDSQRTQANTKLNFSAS